MILCVGYDLSYTPVPAYHFFDQKLAHGRGRFVRQRSAFHLVRQVLPRQHQISQLTYPHRHGHQIHHPLEVDSRRVGRVKLVSMSDYGLHLTAFASHHELMHIPV